MKNHIFISILLIAVIVLVSGCTTSESGNTATPSVGDVNTQSEGEIEAEILSTATHASVMTTTDNWDADAEDDGLIIYPSLDDDEGEVVKFEGIELDVDIEVWTTKFEDFKTVKDRKAYSGTGTINSWKDGNFMFSGGIKVPFEDITTVASDSEFGMVFVEIHLPDGRTLEAKEDIGVRIKPE